MSDTAWRGGAAHGPIPGEPAPEPAAPQRAEGILKAVGNPAIRSVMVMTLKKFLRSKAVSQMFIYISTSAVVEKSVNM